MSTKNCTYVLLNITFFLFFIVTPIKIVGQELDSIGNYNKQSTCECNKNIKSKICYAPSLNGTVSYNLFCNLINYKLDGGEEMYDNLFYSRSRFSYSSRNESKFLSCDIVSSEPLKFIHPNNTYTINLTPCTNDSSHNYYKTPIKALVEYPLNRYFQDFDYEAFDKSAKSYIDILLEISNDDIYSQTLEFILFGTGYNIEPKINIPAFVRKINKKYKTDLSSDFDYQRKFIDQIVTELAEREIDFAEFISQEFILTNKSNNPINIKEKEKLEEIFVFKFYDPISKVDELTTPTLDLQCPIDYMSILLNTNMVKKYGQEKVSSLAESLPNNMETAILFNIRYFDYSIKKGIRMEEKSICSPLLEIAGTDILLDIKEASLVESKINSHFLEKEQFPLLSYDSLLNSFSGLSITEAVLHIPFKENNILASASNIILNNMLISGSILLPYTPMDNTDKIRIENKSTNIETTVKELKDEIERKGLKCKILQEDKLIKIYFKKYAINA